MVPTTSNKPSEGYLLRTLIDVDGVVADLMGGFRNYLLDLYGVELDLEKITRHNIEQSPALKELNDRVDLDAALTRFLATKDVYQYYVDPFPEALEAIEHLRKFCEPIFVTAILKTAPSSYESKFNWCRFHFGTNVPFFAVPSTLKQYVNGTIGIDDRYDICNRYRMTGKKAFLMKRPWSEEPEGAECHNWRTIISSIESLWRRWNE